MKRTCPICQKKYISRKIVDDIIKDFPDDKSTWITMECPNNENHGRIMGRLFTKNIEVRI